MTKYRTRRTVLVSSLLAFMAVMFLATGVSAQAFPSIARATTHARQSSELLSVVLSAQPGSSMHPRCGNRPTSKIMGASGQEVIKPPSLINNGVGKDHPACIFNLTHQSEQLTYNGSNFGPAIPPRSGLLVYITRPPGGTAVFDLAPPGSSATWTVTFTGTCGSDAPAASPVKEQVPEVFNIAFGPPSGTDDEHYAASGTGFVAPGGCDEIWIRLTDPATGVQYWVYSFTLAPGDTNFNKVFIIDSWKPWYDNMSDAPLGYYIVEAVHYAGGVFVETSAPSPQGFTLTD